jgi:hypothetical protein
MLAAFVTGFAQEASSMIDERNKEIADRALTEMETLLKKKMKADEAAIERRDELRKQAAELRARSGNRLTESQIVGILENGYGSIAIEQLKEAGTISDDAKMKKLFTPADPNDQRLIEDYIKEATTLTGKAPAQIEETTAFGLKTRAGEAIRQRASAKTGMPLEEMYKTELPGVSTKPSGALDLSVLQREEKAPTKAEVLASYAKKINEATSNDEVAALQKERDLYISRGFPKEEDKEKALNFSGAISGLQKAITQAYNANSKKLGNSTFTIANDGTIGFAPGSADHSKFFKDLVRRSIINTTERYKDVEGRLPEPIAAAVNFMGNEYGISVGKDRRLIVGQAEAPSPPPPPPPPGAASATPAVTGTKPSLMQFLIRARKANPQASDADLKAYYEKTYGNK